MRPRSPEVGNRRSDSLIILGGIGIHISGICKLALGGRVDTMDLASRKRLQGGQLQGLGQSIDSSMLEELIASLVNLRSAWIFLQITGSSYLAGKVIACVQKFEEASDSIQLLVYKVNATFLAISVCGLAICLMILQKHYR